MNYMCFICRDIKGIKEWISFKTIKTFIIETYRYDDGGEGLPPNPDSLKKKMLRSAK